jgi:phosphoribosylamine--glycine ligase
LLRVFQQGAAQRAAYAGVGAVAWANELHRTDIGWRAIARESA